MSRKSLVIILLMCSGFLSNAVLAGSVRGKIDRLTFYGGNLIIIFKDFTSECGRGFILDVNGGSKATNAVIAGLYVALTAKSIVGIHDSGTSTQCHSSWKRDEVIRSNYVTFR